MVVEREIVVEEQEIIVAERFPPGIEFRKNIFLV
jgi:hypothetical protein